MAKNTAKKKGSKKISALIKLQIPPGKANPSPPVGPALGQHGLNIMDFCKQFNDRTKKETGALIPVVITVYQNRSFDFVTKTPPVSVLLKEAAKIKSGSSRPQKEKAGKVTAAQIEEIAKRKLPDLNCLTLESAKSQVAGTAASMGLDLV